MLHLDYTMELFNWLILTVTNYGCAQKMIPGLSIL
jgi:hypothetical protein